MTEHLLNYFLHFLNYFTCASHPNPEGDRSVLFSQQELFLTTVGKIKITPLTLPPA